MTDVLTTLAWVAVYLLPAIICCVRNHRNFVAIILIDVLLGWTVAGWIAALIWAFTSPGTDRVAVIQAEWADERVEIP
jgi:hypothetical protein